MAMGLTLSLALIALSLVYPSIKVDAEGLLAAIDFDQLLLYGALGFLLFAGALHIEFGNLREHRVARPRYLLIELGVGYRPAAE
jgi:CPA1 family monovalent cation:H+ antiporter